MIIGERLRTIRESKNLSQGEVEKRTGLLRCYTSRVENGHTVPSLGTLEKYAHAMEIPLYQFFCEGGGTPKSLHVPHAIPPDNSVDSDEWRKFVNQLSRMSEQDRRTLFFMAQKMAPRKSRTRRKPKR